MIKIKLVKVFVIFSLLIPFLISCNKELPANNLLQVRNSKDGIAPYSFNWETVNWMPTPPGQSLISPPWIGQGSISSLYGLNVANDHKASDGWVLVYNTFDPNSAGNLSNPYFMLYNKYRGLLRIYMYTTTQFISSSTYIKDGLNIISSNYQSSMLNFLSTDIIDPNARLSSFSQLEPAPSDGSQPLASNKWYMLQYEIAYDPLISNQTNQNIGLGWFTNFNSVSNITLGGTLTGTIKTPVGASTPDLNGALQNAGSVAGNVAASFIGTKILQNNGDAATGDNTLGLPNDIYKKLNSAVDAALSAAQGNIPGTLKGLFSAIIGGSSGSSSPTINLDLNATLSLQGTSTSSGSFPSSPTSVYIPGTIISSTAQNYIPLYNKPLGVFNLTERPKVRIQTETNARADGYYYNYYTIEGNPFNLLAINPEILNDPNSVVTRQSFLIVIPDYFAPGIDYNVLLQRGDNQVLSSGRYENIGNHSAITQDIEAGGDEIPLFVAQNHFFVPGTFRVAVRVSFDIVHFDGTPTSTFIKTFWADVIPEYI